MQALRLGRPEGRPLQADVASFSAFKDKTGADESVRLAADFVRTNMTKLLREKPEIVEGPIAVDA